MGGWDLDKFPSRDWPIPPFNVEAFSPLVPGIIDLKWDNPQALSANTPWRIVGVNVYRSDNGDLGPYLRLNGFPLGGVSYRDYTENITISKEIISWNTSWKYRGDSPNNCRWVFKTKHKIVSPTGGWKFPSYSPYDMVVNIDGVDVFAKSLHGESKEVELYGNTNFNHTTQKFEEPILPNADSVVFVTYKTNINEIRDDLDRKISYRISSVATNNDGLIFETPLHYCQPIHYIKVESLDYIWREAVRRNNWILEQGGERVKLFLRKLSGQVCDCITESRRASHIKQPRNHCLICFGTGYVGGYEGPYEIIVAPDDGERKIAQHNWGRYVEHMYEVWMGPTPLIAQRDFLFKQNGEAFSIGPVRRPTNRGNILQQHFSINLLDIHDIRYRIPIDGLEGLPWPQTRTTIWPNENILVYPFAEYGPMNQIEPSEHSPAVYPVGSVHQAVPLSTDKSNIDDSREHRGRTQTWENTNY